MITVRSEGGGYVEHGPAREVVTRRTARLDTREVDVYLSDGPALLGITWSDGSHCVCDWVDGRECLTWVKMVLGRARVHTSPPDQTMRARRIKP